MTSERPAACWCPRLQRGRIDICANYRDAYTEKGRRALGPKKKVQDRHPHGGDSLYVIPTRSDLHSEVDEDAGEEHSTAIRTQPERANERLA